MKNYVLVYLVKPDQSDRKLVQAWRDLLDSLEPREPLTEEKGKISQSSWLLDRENDVSILAKVVHSADQFRIEYRVMFFSSDSD